MRTVQTVSRSSILSGTILFVAYVFSLAADLPGHLSYDSVIQLAEGRRGAYASWHPPVMSWFLGLSDSVIPGTSLFVALNALVFFGALASLLFLFPRARWFAPAAALAIVVLPQTVIYQGTVWKDVLFANVSIAGFVALAHVAAHWHSQRLRYVLLTAAAAFFVIACLARQNGILVLLCGAGALFIIVHSLEARGTRSAAAYVGAAFAATLVLFTMANFLLGLRIVAPWGPARQFQLLQLYDVIGATASAPGLDLGRLSRTDPSLDRAIRTDGIRLFTPQRNDPLASSPTLQAAARAAPEGVIAGAWRELIFRHPWIYMKIRFEDFRWVFAAPDVGKCLPFLVGVSGPAGEMDELDLQGRWDDRDDALNDYGRKFVGTPIFSHVLFLFLGLASLIPLLLRRRPADVAIAAMLVSAVAFTLSFFVISIACDYRYLYFLDLAALTGFFYLALDPPGGFGTVRRD